MLSPISFQSACNSGPDLVQKRSRPVLAGTVISSRGTQEQAGILEASAELRLLNRRWAVLDFLGRPADMLISRLAFLLSSQWIGPRYSPLIACSKSRGRSSRNTLTWNIGAIRTAHRGPKSCGASRTKTA